MDLKTPTRRSAQMLPGEYLAERQAQAERLGARWRAASRVALLVLLAGATLQLYFLHVYATIAAMPTLAVALLN